MIDEAAIRATLEGVLGSVFAGLSVSRVGEGEDPDGPFIRTHLTYEPRVELYRGIRRINGLFGILVHVPSGDGIPAAESIAAKIPPLYRTDETASAVLSGVTIREISLMSAYRGTDEKSEGARWIVVPVQIDWRVDITA